MELADVTDSKSVGGNTVRVRPPPSAPAPSAVSRFSFSEPRIFLYSADYLICNTFRRCNGKSLIKTLLQSAPINRSAFVLLPELKESCKCNYILLPHCIVLLKRVLIGKYLYEVHYETDSRRSYHKFVKMYLCVFL